MTLEERLGHLGAARVVGADEEDVLHGYLLDGARSLPHQMGRWAYGSKRLSIDNDQFN
jgi:hypothetical protein